MIPTSPCGDFLGTLVGWERRLQQAQCAGHDQRRADTHHRAHGDQAVRGAHQGTRSGRRSEDRQACEQCAFAAETVAQSARRQEQHSEDERVGVDDPQNLGV
jgi:hypothetical protein